MGLALKADQGQQLQSGILSHLFGQGGFDETQSKDNDDLSIEDRLSLFAIDHAEWNLGHLVETPHDLERSHIENVFHLDDYRNHKIIEYSRDDVQKEQSGGPSDANLVTAGGYLKQAIQDPDAHIQNESQKTQKNEFYVQLFISEQQRIERMLSALQEKIDAHELKIAEYNEQIHELEDAQSLLDNGDINEDSQRGRDKRQKIEKVLQKQGLSLDDFRKADGTIDEEALRARLETDQAELEEQRRQAQRELDEYKEKYRKVAEENNVQVANYDRALESGDVSAIKKAEEALSANEATHLTVITNRISEEERLQNIQNAAINTDVSPNEYGKLTVVDTSQELDFSEDEFSDEFGDDDLAFLDDVSGSDDVFAPKEFSLGSVAESENDTRTISITFNTAHNAIETTTEPNTPSVPEYETEQRYTASGYGFA